ncbi:MAG: hypothetical protein PHD48_12810, partial [Alphaproteobacteria bacterium]|nr:hypothetical protein [Alphaproteobacteria bacterium]
MAIQNAKWFEMNAYLNNKLAQVGSAYTMDSLVQALNAAGFVGEQGYYNHFMQYGHTEDVSPSAGFSASQYYIFKAASYYHSGDVSAVTDAEAATIKQLIKDAGMDAWTHYQKYGTVEQINASNTFDTAAYLQAKADAMNASSPAPAVPWTAATIATAIQDAGMSAYEHFMNYKGVGPGEVASTDTYAVDPSKQAANAGQTFTLTADQDTLAGTAGNDTYTAGSVQT